MQTSDRPLPTPDPFRPRPGFSASAGRDNIDSRGHIGRPVLAGFRSRHDMARVVGRTGGSDAMARGERRRRLHPRALRGLVDHSSGCRRSEAQAHEPDGERACATSSLLYSVDCSHLDGDISPRPVAPSLGENDARPKSTANAGLCSHRKLAVRRCGPLLLWLPARRRFNRRA